LVPQGPDQGKVEAQFLLGKMYAQGHGVPQDYVQAYMWFNLAAAHDSDEVKVATEARDEVAAKMTPDQIAEAQRMARGWVQSHPSTR
jgi:TPR repeat protein